MENGHQRVYGMTGSLFGNITAALNIRSATRLKPLRGAAARILFGVWLLGIVVFSQYLTGQVKASLMVKAPVSRIDTVTELLSREPPIRPVTLKASPFMNMLQFSGLDTYRALHERIVRFAGELPQSEIYTTKILRDVLDGRTAILMDTTGNRISVARSCSTLGGFFHVSSDILETADFRWYINQRLDKALVRAMDVRIRWLLEAGVPFMRHHEMFPQPATCFLDFQGAPGDQYEDLRFQDLSLAFMFLPLAAAFTLLVLGAELVVHRCARLRRPRLARR
ncbi:hypothetical protein IscW_ISCW017104 [Ixodes scapularis]|uniref:Uncharacterized protein n=1 Tax=Ixodes scapularis TaxID=6945 RepID=B7P8W1_IXOSC|nr:hypothetical protein IscW_ISCW017104 [Ixodes scapularis]|eukprot:XP_002403261.1 hypothetical protein IscW_ISCW017104 [Ixodes scapularis]